MAGAPPSSNPTGIDSHVHFWTYDASQYPWMGPQHAPIARDFTPLTLSPLLSAAGLRGCVAVQARQTPEETAFLLALADAHPDIVRGVVGWVELSAPPAALEAQLARFAPHPALKGVRHVLHDEEDDDFMLRPAFRAGLATLAARGLAYDLLIFPRHLPNAARLVAEFPEQRFVVDHVAKPKFSAASAAPPLDSQWLEGMRALAAHPNVFVKLSGMVTEHGAWHGWGKEDFVAVLDALLAAFGPDRLMYGSDWPVALLSATYEGQAGIVQAWCKARLNDAEAEAVMGGNAARFYRL